MDQSKPLMFALLLLLMFAGQVAARDWELEGRAVTGELVRLRDGRVTLRLGNETVDFEVAELGRRDQQFISSVTKPRTWTNQAGKQIIASFVSRDADNVTILKDGKEFTIPIASLCQAHQQYLQKTFPWTAVEVDLFAPDDAATPAAETTLPAASVEDRGPVPVATPHRPIVRDWITATGKKTRGRFLRLKGHLVWFETDEGEKPEALISFRERDQAMIRQIAAGTFDEKTLPPTWPFLTTEREWTTKFGDTMRGRFFGIYGGESGSYGGIAMLEIDSKMDTKPELHFVERDQAFFRQLVAGTIDDRDLPEPKPPALVDDGSATSEPLAGTSDGDGSSVTGTVASSNSGADTAALANAASRGSTRGQVNDIRSRMNAMRNNRDQPRPVNDSDESGGGGVRIRGGRGIAKLVIAVGIFLVSCVVGLLRMLFRSRRA